MSAAKFVVLFCQDSILFLQRVFHYSISMHLKRISPNHTLFALWAVANNTQKYCIGSFHVKIIVFLWTVFCRSIETRYFLQSPSSSTELHFHFVATENFDLKCIQQFII